MAKAKPQVSAVVQDYLDTIAEYDKEFKPWEERAKKISDRYRDEKKRYSSDTDSVKFNVLWSNVQTLLPAVYSRTPQPDVSRRFRDTDPVGRVAALILERALDFDIQHHSDFRTTMGYSMLDRFLGGRAVGWVRYEPEIVALEAQAPEGDDSQDVGALAQLGLAGMPGAGGNALAGGIQAVPAAPVGGAPALEKIVSESAPIDYVHWRDFGHSVARIWEEVSRVWRIVYMKRPELIKRFGEEVGRAIPLDSTPMSDKTRDTQQNIQGGRCARIYEIWDKDERRAVWLHKSMPDLLDEVPDPLELESFFPCPRPIFATITTDTLVPVPDFIMYQDQANELDTISDRVDGLIKALKVRGVYNAAVPELRRLFTETANNDLIPVQNWQAFAEASGLAGAMDLVDLKPIAEALMSLYNARHEVLDQIYSLTGLADIMRGESDPSTTAKAEGIKARFGSLRLRDTQGEVARYASDLIRLKAQVMCGKFQADTLTDYSCSRQLSPEDQAIVPAALQLLKESSIVRDFRIEVAADSLVQLDEAQEKQDRTEFLTAVSTFLQQAVPAAAAHPELAPLLMQMLKFAVAGFKVGKTLEGVIDQAIDQLAQAAKQSAGQQQKPTPEQIKLQADLQLEQLRQQGEREKLQGQMELEKLKANLSIQVAQAQQEAQAAQDTQSHQQMMQGDILKASLEAQGKEMQIRMDAFTESVKRQVEVLIAQIGAASRIEVAEIGKQSTLGPDQIAAAMAAQGAAQ